MKSTNSSPATSGQPIVLFQASDRREPPTMSSQVIARQSGFNQIAERKFDGRAFAQNKLDLVRRRVLNWQKNHHRPLVIASFYPKEDTASVIYTRLKREDAMLVGVEYQSVGLSLSDGRHTWLRHIMSANQDKKVHAVMVQKPAAQAYQQHWEKISQLEPDGNKLPFSSWWQNLAEAIAPEKDIDGLAPMTLFKLEKEAERVAAGRRPAATSLHNFLLPATAQAVIDICLAAAGSLANLRQFKVAVIGRSVIVGRPAAAGLQLLGVKTDLLSSQSNLAKKLSDYQVIISATGKSGLISAQMIRANSILIDVGAPKPEFQSDCYTKAAFYTPVPNGVGPVTRACLLENLFKLQTLNLNS